MSRKKSENWQDIRDAEFTNKGNRLKPRTQNQAEYIRAIHEATVILVKGVPGAGKTYIAVGTAVGMLLDGLIDKIIITRPLITCGEGLGFLPGNVEEKLTPYLIPILDALDDFLTPYQIQTLFDEEKIIMRPLELMRGNSFKDSVILLDEAENCTYKQLKMFLTRISTNCKAIVTGDIEQSDLKERNNPFAEVIDRLQGNEQIATIELTYEDCQRNKLINWIDSRL